MGLDIVEYVVAIEDAFEITIPNADAATLDTPGKLIDYLCARLKGAPDGPPLVQTAFYRLRSALADELGVERRQVHPDSMLSDLSARTPSAVWKGVASRLGVEAKLLTHAPAPQWLANLRVAPPRSVGDVARQLAMLAPAAVKPRASGWTRTQVTEVALRLLEHEIGLAVSPSQLDLTFVRDLGMG